MTINANDIAAMFAAFIQSQGASAQEPTETPMGKARQERADQMRVNKGGAAIAEATAEAGTLAALREAAVNGYGTIVRYGAGMNDEFGKGWPLVTKKSDPEQFAKIEAERKTFVALGKARGLANPAVHWANAKKHALVASGHAKKGPVEAKAIKVRIIEDASRILLAAYRDGAKHKQAANVAKAIELLEGAVTHLGGKVADLKVRAAKPLPGQAKGS